MATASDLPAILGGDPCVTEDQTAANRWPVIAAEDEAAVLDVLRSGEISTNPVIRQLENDYAALTGMPYALAHANGTSALMAAFFALDLDPGDEILVPSATFWASVLPMAWMGIVPVFCESEPERLGIDPVDMENKITERTKAVVVVHLWGLPSKMTEIYEVTKRHGLKVIEDAAHAHGATWRNRQCGSLGDICIFSLQGDKLAPAGEGGVLLCREKDYFERAAMLGDITRIIELEGPSRRFAATSFGIKTRIAPLSAALGRTQLSRLMAQNRIRNDNIVSLSKRLEPLGIHTFLAPPHIERTYFEFIVRRDAERLKLPMPLLIAALRAEGCVVSAPRYPLLHEQPIFTEGHLARILRLPPDIPVREYRAEDLPRTRAVGADLIKLPSFPNASGALLDSYAEAFHRVCSRADEIMVSETAQKVARMLEQQQPDSVELRGV